MNIQQTIIKGIKDQLYLNNYLVLPNFGGFVLRSIPSRFVGSGGLLAPPAKIVSFNAQLKQNDGTLSVWLQKELNCAGAEALQHIHDFSEFCMSILYAKRRHTLNGIGFFYLDTENNICFEPQADANFLTDSFGLFPVSARPLEAEAPARKTEHGKIFIDRQVPVTANQKLRPKTSRRWIAPIILTVLLFGVLSIIVSNSRMNGHLRSSLFGGHYKTLYQPLDYPELKIVPPLEAARPYIADANGVAFIELEDRATFAVKTLEVYPNPKMLKNSLPAKNTTYTKIKKFQVVLGCFTVFENATRMVSNLTSKGTGASIAGKNHRGMYIVSSGAFDSREEAAHKLAEIKTDFPEAWIKSPE